MAAWPGSLPEVMEPDEYAEQALPQTIRSDMDAGPPKVRRRFSAGISHISRRLAMTSAQVATFETFFNTDTAAGSLRFDWWHPRKKATVQARFMGAYSISRTGSYYWVSFNLEILP